MYIVCDIMESTVHYTTHPGIMTLKLSMGVVAVMWSIISPYFPCTLNSHGWLDNKTPTYVLGH